MAVLKWLFAGLVGAGIGGAIWVLVGYFGNMEVGYIAWGIGLLAGLGVRRKMAEGEVNAAAGIAAMAAALLVIAASKFYVAKLHVDELVDPMIAAEQEVDPVEFLAYDVIDERVQAGQEIVWPDEEGTELPPDVLAEAQTRWEAKPEAEKTQYVETKRVERAQTMEAMRVAIRDEAFKGSFGPYDLLWFGLAMFTAFKVGRGSEQETPVAEATEPTTPADPPATAS